MAIWPQASLVLISGYSDTIGARISQHAERALQQMAGDDPEDEGNHSVLVQDLSGSPTPPPFSANSLVLSPLLQGGLNKPTARLTLSLGTARYPQLDRDFLYRECGATIAAAYMNIRISSLKRQRQYRWAGYLAEMPEGYVDDGSEDGLGRDNIYDPAQGDSIVVGKKSDEIEFEAENIKMALLGIELGSDPKEHILGVTSVPATAADGEWARVRVDNLVEAYLDNVDKYSAFQLFPLIGVNGEALTESTDIEPLIDAGRTLDVTYTYLENVETSAGTVSDYFPFGTEEWDDLHWSNFSVGDFSVAYGGTPSALPLTRLPVDYPPPFDT